MADILELFKNLSKFYNNHLNLEDIENIYDKFNKSKENYCDDDNDDDLDEMNETLIDDSDSELDDDQDDEDENVFDNLNNKNKNKCSTMNRNRTLSKISCIEKIPMVELATKNSQVLSVLQELCTMIRNIRESNRGYDNTYDCWDRVNEISPKSKYFAFLLSLLRLVNYKPILKLYRKLSMSVASLYILSLTIPGAKQYHIFDEIMINHVLEIFHLIDLMQLDAISKKIRQQDRVEIWISFVNLCEDLKIMFRYVHFDEYKDVRNSIIWELNKLMFNLHVNGYDNIYAANLHTKCFEIYDEIINAHNGDPEETLMKIMRINYCLHIFPPSPRRRENFGNTTSNAQLCEHISDWYVNIISKYPRIVSKVLQHYIECVITNPEKDWRTEQIQRALDYAAKYDSALYTKCNESVLEFLMRATNSDDSQIRSNGTDLLIKMLQIESKVNWELFRHEVSNVSREVYIIKELITRLLDVNNGIKLKVLHGLHQACTKGTKDAVKIMKEGIRFAIFNADGIELPQEPKARRHEIRYERPQQLDPAYTFEGHEIIEPYFSKLPDTLYHLLRCSLAHTRRAALLLLESVVSMNPLVIYNTNFVKEISKLGQDPTTIVRKQALLMIDSILGLYPNCYPVVYTWCKVIVPLFKDSDQKLVEIAWDCFKNKVFDNIRGIDNSNRAEHFMPWIILRVLLSSQQRQFLQCSINATINKNVVDQKILALIESHTLTANSTEAWTLLSFVAGKVKSREPDSLVSTFIKSIQDRSWNAGQNLQIILEVLAICVQDFSHSALNMAFSCIVTLMKNGTIPPCVISKAFSLCLTISIQSETKKKKGSSSSSNVKLSGQQQHHQKKRSPEQLKWIEDIHNICEKYLLVNLKNFHTDRSKILSYLFSYTETNLELVKYPNKNIIKFVHKFLEAYLQSKYNKDFQPDDMNVLNLMIILAARFSIRQTNIAEITCALYCRILRHTERPTTVNNIIIAMTDLCKKHTYLVESGLQEILKKLQSPYIEIRLVAFKNLAQMVLQDLIKLRGNLLLNLMSTLLDEDVEMSNRATEFFLTYLEKKNSSLFHNCLLECPFVYNEYMHFEGFESFLAINKKIISPLKGEEKRKSRQMLYKVYMYELNEISLLMFFDNLRLIYAKIANDPRINSEQGHATIIDMLFIFKEICILSLEKKDAKDKIQSQQEQEDVADDAANAVANETAKTKENETGTNARNTGGRGRRKENLPTMNDAMAVVEKTIGLIPKISDIIMTWDLKFQEHIKELSVAVCMCFENFTEFAKPDSFWSKYRQIAKKKKFMMSTNQRKRKATNNDESEDEASDDDDDSDGNQRNKDKDKNKRKDNDEENNDDDHNNDNNESIVQIPHKRPRNTMSILFEPFLV